MNYDDWSKTVPGELTNDALWNVKAYRLALFLADLGWHDVTKLAQDRRSRGLSDQLYRALGSIGANLSEGYSRGSGKDRVRFYEYSLGSARESRGWYFNARHLLGLKVSQYRIALTTEIIRLILTMIPGERETHLHEDSPYYKTMTTSESASTSDLLTNVPIPELTEYGVRNTAPALRITS